MSGIVLSPDQRREVVEAYVAGGTSMDVGKRFNVCDTTVRNILREQGVSARKNGIRALTVPRLALEDAAYIAGIIDGEGSISLQKGNRAPHWRVTIWNTDKDLIDWLYSTIKAGNISSRLRENTKVRGTKPCYDYQISSRQNALALLTQVLPFLKVKRQKAEDAIRFIRTELSLMP